MGVDVHQDPVLEGAGLHFIGIGHHVAGKRGSAGIKAHLRPVGKPAPPRPRRPESSTNCRTSSGVRFFDGVHEGLVAAAPPVFVKGGGAVRAGGF